MTVVVGGRGDLLGYNRDLYVSAKITCYLGGGSELQEYNKGRTVLAPSSVLSAV